MERISLDDESEDEDGGRFVAGASIRRSKTGTSFSALLCSNSMARETLPWRLNSSCGGLPDICTKEEGLLERGIDMKRMRKRKKETDTELDLCAKKEGMIQKESAREKDTNIDLTRKRKGGIYRT